MGLLEFKPIDLDATEEICLKFREDSFIVSFGNADPFHEADGKGGERYLQWLRAKVVADPRCAVHVWLDGKIIGQIELGRQPGDLKCGYVNLYYLIPEMRGRGLGTELDTYAIGILKTKGFTHVRLAVSPTNMRAVRFYKRLGWIDLGPRPNHPQVHEMGKSL